MKVAVMVPLPVPPEVTVHQPALLWAVQVVLEVTVKFVVPAAAVTLCDEGLTLRVGAVPACTTVTVCLFAPFADTVMVAVRLLSSLLAVKVAVMVPLPVPPEDTVHQPALLWAVQVVLEVTVKFVVPAAAVTLYDEGLTLRVGVAPACTTVTV